MNGEHNETPDFVIGGLYRNKHNNKRIEVVSKEISDYGNPLWTAHHHETNGRTYEVLLMRSDRKHWTRFDIEWVSDYKKATEYAVLVWDTKPEDFPSLGSPDRDFNVDTLKEAIALFESQTDVFALELHHYYEVDTKEWESSSNCLMEWDADDGTNEWMDEYDEQGEPIPSPLEQEYRDSFYRNKKAQEYIRKENEETHEEEE